MKRKLFLGLAALAALTITSCQKDLVINQLPEEQPIGFGTYVGRDAQTKASVITTLNLPDNDFGVFGFLTEGDWTSSATPNFMYNQKVDGTRTGNNVAWSYSPLKYWPNVVTGTQPKLSFYAYSPYKESVDAIITTFSASTATGVPTLIYSVPSTVSNQIDLLYATPITNKTKNDYNSGADSVKFTFNHALSRIGFKAKTDVENNKVTVKSITLTGKFTTSGTCSLSDGTFTSTSQTENTSYIVNFTTGNTATGTTAQELAATEGYIMIIPTTEFQSTSTISVSVNYDLEVYDTALSGNYAAAVNKTEEGTITEISFDKGKAYTLILIISPSDPIKFAVESITDWSTTTTSGTPEVTTNNDKNVTVN